jgi:hypothetical protein
VTLAALQGETQSLMIGRSRFLKRFQVATRALCRKTLPIELSYRSHFVTGIAIHDRVRTDQREPVLMFVDVVNGDLPTVHAMTDVALRPIFAAVQVGMAILALLANVAEDGIKMAFLAGYVDVHAAERIGRLVVIKLRVLANRHPSCRRMTILAGRFQEPCGFGVGSGALDPALLFTPKAMEQASINESVHRIRKGLRPSSIPWSLWRGTGEGVPRRWTFLKSWTYYSVVVNALAASSSESSWRWQLLSH